MLRILVNIEKNEKLKFFGDLSHNIDEIKELLYIFRIKGSTLLLSIRAEIKYPDVKYFLGEDEKEKELKTFHKFLSNAKTNIINKLDSF